MLIWICIIFNIVAGTIFSAGQTEHTGYYNSDEVKEKTSLLIKTYPILERLENPNLLGISYGKGEEKMLILGGLSACPICTLQVLALAEKLAKSTSDYNTNDANNFYKYATIHLYPIVNLNQYNAIINQPFTSSKYKEITEDGKVKECSLKATDTKDICSIILEIEDYRTIINFQGFAKNSIIHPPCTSQKIDKNQKLLYNRIQNAFKGFNMQSSYDRFGTTQNSLMAEVNNSFILQIEVKPKATKFSEDFPMVVSNALIIYEEYFMNYNNFPDAIIEKIYSSRDDDENGAYNITVPLNISNRSPFTLEKNFNIDIKPTIKQKFLDFEKGNSPSLSFTIISLNDSHSYAGDPNIIDNESKDYGINIGAYFSIPPYGRINAKIKFKQRPRNSVGGFYHYTIKMESEAGLIVLRNYTNNFTEILEELPKVNHDKKINKYVILGSLFGVFAISIIGIICCVMIKHKPGSVFY